MRFYTRFLFLSLFVLGSGVLLTTFSYAAPTGHTPVGSYGQRFYSYGVDVTDRVEIASAQPANVGVTESTPGG